MNCRRLAHEWTELKEGKLPFWRRTGLRAIYLVPRTVGVNVSYKF